MLITNGSIVTWTNPNKILTKHGLLIQNGLISDIGLSELLENKYPSELKVDARNQFIIPGLICSHTHFYGAYARGLNISSPAPKNFMEILNKLWWPLDKALSLDGIYYSTMVSMIDAIKHGTTTLIDHHASQNAISGSLSKILQAAEETGLRIAVCYEISDRDGPNKMEEGIRENHWAKDFVSKQKSNLYASMIGLHASLSLSNSTLKTIVNNFGECAAYHIHVAESKADQLDSIEKSNLRVVERLYKYKILGPKTLAVHGVHLNRIELELLRDTNTWISHQPRSNMNNAVGLPDLNKMLKMGINICLGNDGFSNAMWEEWKTAYLVHKLWKNDPRIIGGQDIIKIAVENNGKFVDQLFGIHGTGTIQIGAPADLIFVDYVPFTEINSENIPWHILFGFRDSMITTTIVQGIILMKDRQIQMLDTDRIVRNAEIEAKNTWNRFTSEM